MRIGWKTGAVGLVGAYAFFRWNKRQGAKRKQRRAAIEEAKQTSEALNQKLIELKKQLQQSREDLKHQRNAELQRNVKATKKIQTLESTVETITVQDANLKEDLQRSREDLEKCKEDLRSLETKSSRELEIADAVIKSYKRQQINQSIMQYHANLQKQQAATKVDVKHEAEEKQKKDVGAANVQKPKPMLFSPYTQQLLAQCSPEMLPTVKTYIKFKRQQKQLSGLNQQAVGQLVLQLDSASRL